HASGDRVRHRARGCVPDGCVASFGDRATGALAAGPVGLDVPGRATRVARTEPAHARSVPACPRRRGIRAILRPDLDLGHGVRAVVPALERLAAAAGRRLARGRAVCICALAPGATIVACMTTLIVARRFCGPSASSNGGYFAGLVASLASQTL